MVAAVWENGVLIADWRNHPLARDVSTVNPIKSGESASRINAGQ